jgi:hypothetical protein
MIIVATRCGTTLVVPATFQSSLAVRTTSVLRVKPITNKSLSTSAVELLADVVVVFASVDEVAVAVGRCPGTSQRM